MTTMLNPVPDDSILDPVHHARIIADMERVCLTANIPARSLMQSAKPFCGPAEIDWLRHFHAYRQQGLGGLLLYGVQSIAVTNKMMAITGALLRNHIDARLMLVNSVLDTAENGDPFVPTVLMVPNLCLSATGKSLPAWKVQMLFDVLLGRLAANKPSVLYIESEGVVTETYGQPFMQHLQANYRFIADGQGTDPLSRQRSR